MSRSNFFEFAAITIIFLFVLPIMFTLMVAVLLNSGVLPEIRIAQSAIIVLVSGLVLYSSATYFLRKLQKQIETRHTTIGSP